MSGWGYLVLLVVFLALSLSMRAILFRRASGKATAGKKEHNGAKK